MSGGAVDVKTLNVPSHIGHDIPRTRIFPMPPPDIVGHVRRAWSTYKFNANPLPPLVQSSLAGGKTLAACLGVVSPLLIAFGLAQFNGIDVSRWVWIGLLGLPILGAALAAHMAYPRFEYSYLGDQGFAVIDASGSPTNVTHRDALRFDDRSLNLYLRFRVKPKERLAGINIRQTEFDAWWLDENDEIKTRLHGLGIDLRLLSRVMQGRIASDPVIAKYLALPNRDEQVELSWCEDEANRDSFNFQAVCEWINAHRERSLRDLREGSPLHFRLAEEFPGAAKKETLGEAGNTSECLRLLERRSESLKADFITITQDSVSFQTENDVHAITPGQISELTLDQLTFNIEFTSEEAIPLTSGKTAKRVLMLVGRVADLTSLIAALEEVSQCSLVDQRPAKIRRILPLSTRQEQASAACE